MALLAGPARAQEPPAEGEPLALQGSFEAALTAEDPAELRAARAELDALAARARATASPSQDDTRTRLLALLHISWVTRELGDADASRAALEELRGVLEGLLPPTSSEAWQVQQTLGMIRVAAAQGALRRAADACAWALGEIATTPFHRAALLVDELRIQRALGAHGEADASIERLEHELETLRGLGQATEAVGAYFEAYLRIGRAQGWMSLGVLDRATGELDGALEAAERSGDPGAQLAAAQAYNDLTLLQERRGIALQVLDRFLELHGEELDPEQRAGALLQRAVTLSELVRIGSAHGESAEAALRAFLDEPGARVDHLARARLELVDVLLRDAPDAGRRDEAGALLTALEAAPDGGKLENEALAEAQRARWLLAGEPTEAELDRAIATTRAAFERLLEAWRRAPRQRPGGLGFLNLSYRRMVISALIDLELARDPSAPGVERALAVALAAQAEGGLVQDLGGGPLDLAALRARLLGTRHGCLVLVPGRHTAHLFAFDREHILHRHLPSRTSLVPRIDAFLGALFASPERRASDDGALLKGLAQSASELAAAFLDQDVRALLATWTSVTVVGSEQFRGLPLECLPAGPEGELLGLTHAIDVIPSLPLAARLAELEAAGRGPAVRDLLLVADLSPDQPLPDMRPVPERELRTAVEPLLAPFETQRTELLLGAEARWPAVAAALSAARPVSVLHVLAHGAYDSERERGACLALRTETAARVFPEDVEALPACARLVVLSACASALGPERIGSDNLAHLGGAFLRAGAYCVILTRARILLGRTLRLGQALHEHLAAGVPAAEALRRARLAAIDDDPFSPFLACRVQAYGLGALRLQPRKPR